MYFSVSTVGDDSLVCQREENNAHDDNAVGIMYDDLVASRIVSRIAGHVPRNYTPVFARFLMLPNHSIRCRVTGQRVNRGASIGLEVSADYIFYGDAKAIQ